LAPSPSFFPARFWCCIGAPFLRSPPATLAILRSDWAWAGSLSTLRGGLTYSLPLSGGMCRNRWQVWVGRRCVPRWSARGVSGRRSSGLRGRLLFFPPWHLTLER
jgi:hypothetical protein